MSARASLLTSIEAVDRRVRGLIPRVALLLPQPQLLPRFAMPPGDAR